MTIHTIVLQANFLNNGIHRPPIQLLYTEDTEQLILYTQTSSG